MPLLHRYNFSLNMKALILLLIYITINHTFAALDVEQHMSRRQQLLHEEALLAIGGDTDLEKAEERLNNCLIQRKFDEIDYAFDNPKYFNFSHHYFSYKDKIKYSKVYQIIKRMPKGAALHVHDIALLGPDYILNITYLDNLYICFEDKNVKFRFSNVTPNSSCNAQWQVLKQARENANDVTKFDADLRKHFSIVTDDPDKVYPDVNAVWVAFRRYFITVASLLTYRPVWEEYMYDALKAFRNDGVMYVELRTTLPALYELDGTVFDEVVTARALKKAILRFTSDHPDFIGAKLIYAPSRAVNEERVSQYIEIAKNVKRHVPDVFAGFDLVGQEDLGAPLIQFLPELMEGSAELDYFFHAGETNWYGTATDDNLVDAILLGAKRLGHAYALSKHPLLMKTVFDKGIGLEMNVISNAVLSLVRDVRNHPLATFIAEGMPVVISSDDPGAWEADPISYDYYVAFEGVASRLADLRLLKTLALNSLRYSSLKGSLKVNAVRQFLEQWNRFVSTFACED